MKALPPLPSLPPSLPPLPPPSAPLLLPQQQQQQGEGHPQPTPVQKRQGRWWLVDLNPDQLPLQAQ